MLISNWVSAARFCICLFALSAMSTSVSAQSGSLFGNSGALGRSSGTGSANASRGAAAATGGGRGGAGQATGVGGTSALNLNAGTSGVSTDFGTGFVGRSDNSGRFIGNQTSGSQQSFTVQPNQFTRRGGAGGNNFTNRNGNGNFGQGGNGQTSEPVFRPRLRIAFTAPPTVIPEVRSSLTTQFERISIRRPALQGVQIVMNDEGQVTLSGAVASESAKKLAANLIRLQPGVRGVENELTVTPEPAAN